MFEHEAENAVGFIELAQLTARYKNFSTIVNAVRAGAVKARNERLKKLLEKAAVNPGTTADNLVDYQIMQSGFVESLRSLSIFDQMLPSMISIPPNMQASIVTVGAAGHLVGEGKWAPISSVAISGELLPPLKAIAILVVTQELLRLATAGTQKLFADELKSAVAQATDAPVVAALLAGITVGTSSGDARTDIANLLSAVTLKATSKPFWFTSPVVVQQLAGLYGDSGPLFPDLVVPEGGSIAGIPLRASDALTNFNGNGSHLLLVSASDLAGESGPIILDSSTQASLQMSDAPADAAANLVSLFETDSVGLRATREYTFARLRASAVAAIDHVNFAGTSP